MTDRHDVPTPDSNEPTLPDDFPQSTNPFGDVPPILADAFCKRGFTALTSVQRAVLDAESDGRDLRISSQTGSGKTVAIGLAIAPQLIAEAEASHPGKRGPSVVILVPTRELAMQVRDELDWLFAGMRGVGTTVLMGGTAIGRERRALTRDPRIIVGTPGRTLDHLKAGALEFSRVAHIVLDEADRMLDMGFREELEAIFERVPDQRRTHLVSATFDPAVRRLADGVQTRPLQVQGTKLGAANQDIQHIAHLVDTRGAYPAIVNHLLLNEGQRCLIFVERRIDVTRLAEKLSADGFPVQAFSGELPQAQRTRTLGAFRDGTMKTLVSTDVAARGIDVPNIELVIHADPPESAYAYVHRSGRTGRAGRAGRSVLLVPPKAQRYVERILAKNRIVADWQPAPAASPVRKALRRRFRQSLRESLAVEGAPDQTRVDYAKRLLEGRDPAELVAHLLELAQPTPARAPMNVPEPSPSVRARADRRGRRAHARHSAANRASRYVRFSIDWGQQDGAVPKRVLSHVCRLGNIRSQFIGAIKIGPRSTTFDVDAAVADRFETCARRGGAQEPAREIARTRGGAGSGTSADDSRRSKPRAPFKKKRRGKPAPKHPGARAK